MNYYIIGTAGHVDHGKTELIRALTGEYTDRLKEEKERGISIELGFASLSLPNGAKAGVVDVPGHEKFVRQMLAGIGGIDLVLLVIAADEGVMPQTKEHLEIIDLLQVRRGLVVLSKIDLVEREWLDLVKLEIREALEDSIMQDSEIVEVSAVKGEGIDNLKKIIENELVCLPARDYSGACRLPIDRAFSLAGFGTVVTGTMYRGSIAVGDSVVVQPGNLQARVRSLQVHGKKVEGAYAGQRVAVNLPNVEVSDIQKGATLLTPGYLQPVQTLDILLRYLASAAKPLEHRQRVRFHIGTKEVFGRVHLLDRDEVEPGEQVYLQILLEEPVIATRGDRFVIRQYSPASTIGGGKVLDGGNRKYKRYAPGVIESLAIKERGTPEELIEAELEQAASPLNEAEIATETGLNIEAVSVALCNMQQSVDSVKLDGQLYWFETAAIERWTKGLADLLKDYHQKYCLRPGVPKEEVKSKFFPNWPGKIFTVFLNYLQAAGLIFLSENFVRTPGFRAEPQGRIKIIIEKILSDYERADLNPPEWFDLIKDSGLDHVTGEEMLQFALREGNLVKVNNMYFAAGAIDEAKRKIIQLLSEKGEFSTTEAKEKLNTTRKFLIPILEYLDSQKLTRRVNEKRVKF